MTPPAATTTARERRRRVDHVRASVLLRHEREVAEINDRQAREAAEAAEVLAGLEQAGGDTLERAASWLRAWDAQRQLPARHREERVELRRRQKAERKKIGVF